MRIASFTGDLNGPVGGANQASRVVPSFINGLEASTIDLNLH